MDTAMLNGQEKRTWLFFKKLILQHLAQSFESASISEISQNDEAIDQSYLLQLMNEHRLELTLYPLFHKGLEKWCRSLTLQHLMQKKALLSLVQAFDNQKIPYVVLKGLPLNQQLYGDKTLRRSKDIDILIDPQSLERANACLNQLGFYTEEAPGHLSYQVFQKLPAKYQYWVKDLKYWDPTRTISLELHLKASMVGIDRAFKYKSMSALEFMGNAIAILTHEENFLYLCEHGSKHHWSRLQWLIDLGVFFQKIPLRWDVLCALAKKQHKTRSLLEACFLLNREWGLNFPGVAATPWDHFCVLLRHYFIQKQWRHRTEPKRYFCSLKRKIERGLLSFFIYSSVRDKIEYYQSKFFSSFRLCAYARKAQSMVWHESDV